MSCHLVLPRSDCGELHLHSEEPVVPPGAGAPASQADRGSGAGRTAGQRVSQQGGGLQLLGQEEEEEEEEPAGGHGEQWPLDPVSAISISWKSFRFAARFSFSHTPYL